MTLNVYTVNIEMHQPTDVDIVQEAPNGASCMNESITPYQNLKAIIADIVSSLKLKDRENPKGRKPSLTNTEAITCAILKQKQSIATKKSLFRIMEPPCKYNAFVRAINRTQKYLALIIGVLVKLFADTAHPLKFTDATDIPVCLNKNAKGHRTMRGVAQWSKTGKGFFFGLKLHLSSDLDGRVLALRLTPGNSDDRAVFKKMNEKLKGLFIADAGYLSKELARDFFKEGERMLLTAVRANMRRLATDWQIALLNLRMRVEIHFRMLKVVYGLVTSLPRSIDGYLTHHLAAIAAHVLA